MCKTEQKPNETALLRKVVDGLKQELERVKNVVYASKEVLNLEEAAMFLGISKSSLYKMTHNQVIPYFKPNNKMVYFEKSELLKCSGRIRSPHRGRFRRRHMPSCAISPKMISSLSSNTDIIRI